MANNIQLKIIEDALEWDHLLNDWEKQFILSLHKKVTKDSEYKLSRNQNSKLNDINNNLIEQGISK